MIRRIIRKRRPAPALTGISLEEELALIRVELMYGLRVNREAYLRRKVDERNEMATRMREQDPAGMLAELRGSLERAVQPAVVDLESRRRSRSSQGPEPA
ncbi:hypothetical protein FE391_38480 [Nonomuraea sp. KC401]|uniref:Uncharacterized protein n=1 Tax=Nonomuraea longispora TaxID=1848320 RepID=A0A4R4NNV3_9ACTN|nr:MULTISPECIES: hypothetical protein [Nonomuraea]NBE99548.1 hypothetical protein [Nonomuraea sp. K271]TDC11188.1 hypothetical protein E1267_01820 [Nonomuraea longispora]TLF57050.1 hypothetical protein FE391_38480 [Nonomuraea sp. KC401]